MNHGLPKNQAIFLPLLSLTAILGMGQSSCEPVMFTEQVPMADGTKLATDVYLPNEAAVAPTIIFRTPYTRESNEGEADKFVDEGYSVVSQDIRGTWESEGDFFLFMDDGWGANQDGRDTTDWVASQSWNSGQSCLHGYSALAITAVLGAGSSPNSLACAYVKAGTGELYNRVIYQGGAIREETIIWWLDALQGTAGEGALTSIQAVYDHPLDDGFWDDISLHSRYDEVHIPIFHAAGWYDVFLQGGIDDFMGLQEHGGEGAKGQQKLLIGPWSHWGDVGQIQFPNADNRGDQYREWFDYYLKGIPNGIAQQAPVTYFLMGDVDDALAPGNVWKTSETWPPPHTPTAYFLNTGGWLKKTTPLADDAPAGYTYNPADPVPTLGGNNLNVIPGPWDQRLVLVRDDLVIYMSNVLVEPVVISGPVEANLWISSSAIDTDFTVKLMDIYPDWTSINVVDGIARMRSREGQDKEVFMTPGTQYEAKVDMMSTAYAFNRGHRIAIAVSSSNYPRFDVNPNTGGWSHEGGEMISAEQVIYQDAAHPSRLILPVVD